MKMFNLNLTKQHFLFFFLDSHRIIESKYLFTRSKEANQTFILSILKTSKYIATIEDPRFVIDGRSLDKNDRNRRNSPLSSPPDLRNTSGQLDSHLAVQSNANFLPR